jgi:hypothetical protein
VTDLAEIFRVHGPAYREKYGARMPESHRRAMDAIESCRTEARGGRVYFCSTCQKPRFSYHSCKNRHCPKCQNDQASEWLEAQQALLVPAASFLVTFTVPQELRALVRSHQRSLLNVLFRASAEALQQLARDPRFVGGQLGLIGVLHTWTRALVYHPHVHYLVPAGGFSGESWIPSRRSDFLVPVRALSVMFRAKFRDAVKKSDQAEGTALFSSVPRQTWKKPWVVHCQAVGTGEHALEYLARYVFRVALSNSRIQSLENGVVTFRYKDAETKEQKTCRLPGEEFIRRFLQHVLPARFVKVRYYGLFAPSNRERLERARVLAAAQPGAPRPVRVTKRPEPERRPVDVCPTCRTRMSLLGPITPRGP